MMQMTTLLWRDLTPLMVLIFAMRIRANTFRDKGSMNDMATSAYKLIDKASYLPHKDASSKHADQKR